MSDPNNPPEAASPAVVRTHGPTVRRARPWFRWVLVPGGLLLSLLVLEGLLRFFPCPISPFRHLLIVVDDDRGYVLDANISLDFAGIVDRFDPPVRWQSNAQGLRDNRDTALTPLADRRRIALFGDSEAFGWSVNLADTCAKRMEALRPRWEVLNFGVPGYNIANIAAVFEKAVADYRPAAAIYLAHANDLDPPLDFLDSVLIRSELVRRLVYTYQRRVLVEEIAMDRRTPEEIQAFADGLRRIAASCRKAQIPCLAAFVDARNLEIIEQDPELHDYFIEGPGKAIDVSELWKVYPQLDFHLGKEANARLAAILTEHLDAP